MADKISKRTQANLAARVPSEYAYSTLPIRPRSGVVRVKQPDGSLSIYADGELQSTLPADDSRAINYVPPAPEAPAFVPPARPDPRAQVLLDTSLTNKQKAQKIREIESMMHPIAAAARMEEAPIFDNKTDTSEPAYTPYAPPADTVMNMRTQAVARSYGQSRTDRAVSGIDGRIQQIPSEYTFNTGKDEPVFGDIQVWGAPPTPPTPPAPTPLPATRAAGGGITIPRYTVSRGRKITQGVARADVTSTPIGNIGGSPVVVSPVVGSQGGKPKAILPGEAGWKDPSTPAPETPPRAYTQGVARADVTSTPIGNIGGSPVVVSPVVGSQGGKPKAILPGEAGWKDPSTPAPGTIVLPGESGYDSDVKPPPPNPPETPPRASVGAPAPAAPAIQGSSSSDLTIENLHRLAGGGGGRMVKVGEAGYQPSQQVIDTNRLPPMYEFTPPQEVPSAPSKTKIPVQPPTDLKKYLGQRYKLFGKKLDDVVATAAAGGWTDPTGKTVRIVDGQIHITDEFKVRALNARKQQLEAQIASNDANEVSAYRNIANQERLSGRDQVELRYIQGTISDEQIAAQQRLSALDAEIRNTVVTDEIKEEANIAAVQKIIIELGGVDPKTGKPVDPKTLPKAIDIYNQAKASGPDGLLIAPGVRLYVDDDGTLSIGNNGMADTVDRISRSYGISAGQALARMSSSDGMLVDDPQRGPTVYRYSISPLGIPQITEESTVEVDYTQRIQQRAQKYAAAQEAQLERKNMYNKAAAQVQPFDQQEIADLGKKQAADLESIRTRINTAAEKMSKAQVDPQRWARNASFGQTLSKIVYMWAMGMAGGVEGFKVAVNDVNNLIANDIAAQESNIKNNADYIKFLKEEIPAVKDYYASKEAQLKLMQASRLSKFISAMRQARKSVYQMQGKQWIEDEDLDFQAAKSELELRQAEALREAAKYDAAKVQETKRYSTGMVYVPNPDPLKRLAAVLNVIKTEAEIDAIKNPASRLPPIGVDTMVVDPVTKNVMYASSPEMAKKAQELQMYRNKAVGAAERHKQAYEDWKSGKIKWDQYKQIAEQSAQTQIYSLSRLLSPEAVTEAGFVEGRKMTTDQQTLFLRIIGGRSANAAELARSILNPKADPRTAATAVIDQANAVAEQSMPQLFTAEQIVQANRQLNPGK